MIDFKYRPDVDGLRAVAVILVLLFHAGLGFSGGFIGVDVFFVISGFLITGLILKEQDAGTFSLGDFWMRRIRRIIPAATVMVIAVLVVGFFVLYPSDYADLGNSTIAQQLMLANVYFWKTTGYFNGPADLKPLLHTWSLAVEEQFYLGYPLLLMLLHRFGRRATFIVLGLLGIGSLVISQYGVQHHPSATFFLLPTRAWELLIGGLICFLPQPSRIKSWILASCSWSSLAAILAAGWFYTSTTPFPGLTALVPCVATAFLIYCNSLLLSPPAAVLATKPLVFVGHISYSLYLWHWPLLLLARLRFGTEQLPPWISLLSLGASFIFAYVSWLLVETPLRRSAATSGAERRVFVIAVVSLAAMTGIGSVLVTTDGVQARFPAARYPWLYDTQPHEQYEMTTQDVLTQGPSWLGQHRTDGGDVDWLVWGDSHAMAVAPAFEKLCNEKGVQCAVIARSGTPPVFDVWQRRHGLEGNKIWTNAVKETIHRNPIKRIVLVARWSYYLGENTENTVIAPGSVDSSSDKAVIALKNGLKSTIEWFSSRNIEVFVLVEAPKQKGNPVVTYTNQFKNEEFPVRGVRVEDYREQQVSVTRVIRTLRSQRVTVVSLEMQVFDGNMYSYLGDREGPFYIDDNHLSPHGARVLIYPLFEKLSTE